MMGIHDEKQLWNYLLDHNDNTYKNITYIKIRTMKNYLGSAS